ncbi:hypothetical protein KI659_18060 [Litoribacter alkaliphilus]|uniref:Uncharacterized protein n=1 Tax=Litoribacter ruber TaxID=702568 RepID=A0AAP2CJJ9_9BACT|nr:hypothetical protein [Litoribacter alkaliphilus]MBS9525931.1 hypothetical protein [Litoribacter alkaliphilus]
MPIKNSGSTSFGMFLVSLLLMISGVVMVVRNLVAVGINSRTLQSSGFGGHYLILIGLVFLGVAYYSLSPFSRWRNLSIRKVIKKGKSKK